MPPSDPPYCLASLAEVVFRARHAEFAGQGHALRQLVVQAAGDVLVRLEACVERVVVDVVVAVLALAVVQAELQLVGEVPSALQQVVQALHVALVAVGQDADALAVLDVGEQAERAGAERGADLAGHFGEVVALGRAAAGAVELLRLHAGPHLDALGLVGELRLHLRIGLGHVQRARVDRAEHAAGEGEAATEGRRAVGNLAVVVQVRVAGTDVAERDAAALRGLRRRAGTEQSHVGEDRVGAEDAVVAADLHRAGLGRADREEGLAHVDVGVGVHARGRGRVHHDADGAADVDAVLGGLELGDQAAGQEAVTDRGLVALARAAERAAGQRQATDGVARAARRRVVGVDDAADVQFPVAALDRDGTGVRRTGGDAEHAPAQERDEAPRPRPRQIAVSLRADHPRGIRPR